MTSVYAQADLGLKVAPALNLGLVPILGEPLEVFRSELFSRDAQPSELLTNKRASGHAGYVGGFFLISSAALVLEC